MPFSVWAEAWKTEEMSNTARFQAVTFKKNTVVKAVRTWVVGYNDPTFDSLTMKIYSSDTASGANAPGVLIATSTNAPTKAEISTCKNWCRELWFEFAGPALRAGEKYNIVINSTGYTHSEASHLAWRKAWPKPVYKDFTPTALNICSAPYAFYVIGGDL